MDRSIWLSLPVGALVAAAFATAPARAPRYVDEALLRKGDHVALIGGAFVERLQHDGWFEATLHARLPDLDLVVRNLGFSADELTVRQRTMSFGSQDEWLARVGATVVVAAFGFNESFAGAAGLPKFKADLETFLDHVAAQKYDGKAAPRVVLLSPLEWEALPAAHRPDAAAMSAQLRLYGRAIAEVAASRGVAFVDLLERSAQAYERSAAPLTLNGIHLNEAGNRALAPALVEALAAGQPAVAPLAPPAFEALRAAVRDKALLWFNRYQATDGYNVYGGRSSLTYDGVSNFTVLQREMEILDAQVAARDARLHALAKGREVALDESKVPPVIPVATNYPGPLPGGKHEFLDGSGAVELMQAAPGLRVELFADEKRFPELARPQQMAWDTKGRLWVAAWPTYPHWEPGQPMNDKLLIFEDRDGDGRADSCKTFAGDLHNPTGLEFWNGGVFVGCAPDLWFLKDTDGDDVADVRERVLHGLSSGDTHHSANSFVIGPDGGLYFQEGTFHQTQIETIWGPQRNHDACVWRYEPRTHRVERHIAYNFANPHGHVFDAWGQEFVTDGTGNDNYYAVPFSGRVVHPDKHRGYFTFFQQRSRPCGGTEILASRHFPAEYQGSYLACNVIGFQGIFQYRIEDDGSGFGATELPPIVQSRDSRFRPVDAEVAPDGSLYFLDWYNPIIGHMQHHLRDPNRDKEHGRIYRVTAPGRPLLVPKKVAGESIAALLSLLAEPEDRVRYRVRLELSARDSAEVVAAARAWAAALPADAPDRERLRLEALWLTQQHGAIDRELLASLLASADPRARAAAARVVRHGRYQLADPLALLLPLARDPHPRVRLEALVGASHFDDPRASQLALDVKRAPMDKFLDYAFAETMRTLDASWRAALRGGALDVAGNEAAVEWLVARAGDGELAKLPRTPAVLEALLTRRGSDVADRAEALAALAKARGTTEFAQLLAAMARVDRAGGDQARHVQQSLGRDLLSRASAAAAQRAALVDLARDWHLPETAAFARAACVLIDGSLERTWGEASGSLRDQQGLLAALAELPPALVAGAFEKVRPLQFAGEAAVGQRGARGLLADYYSPPPARDAMRASFEAKAPTASVTLDRVGLDLPGVAKSDSFGLRLRATLDVPSAGDWRFWLTSDDGSRLWIDGAEVIENDGDQGMVERSRAVALSAGRHALELCYFDAGGAEGLVLEWSGPGVPRQPIASERLEAAASDLLRAAAVRACAALPGHAEEKRVDALRLLAEGELTGEAVALLESLPADAWSAPAAGEAVAALVRCAESVKAEQRTRSDVAAALAFGDTLVARLSESAAPSRAEWQARLRALRGATELVRTVPHQMLYDRKVIVVAVEQPVALVFQNNDLMPHNLVVGAPGSLEAIGTAAEAMATQPGAQEKSFIPALPEVLQRIRLLLPGESETLRFVAPSAPGDYPFVCTFPGHWRVMNGVLRVVAAAQLETARAAAEAAAIAAAAAAPAAPAIHHDGPVREFVKMWSVADLAPALGAGFEKGRPAARGQAVLEAAGCIQCHHFRGAGLKSAPDLSAIGTKYRGVELLKQIVEPSAAILEGYEQQLFFLKDGRDV
ncbi:MAG: c-type cytochrome, partial [Planctomycetes bacterium]|nr:c-type cytochrome [Planctomycetota bacterium]